MKSGRPRLLNNRTERLIIIKSKCHPRATARTLMQDINLNGVVSVDTVKRVLRRGELFGRIAVKKPFLSKKNKKKRFRWCKERISWTQTDWNKIVFSDESKIELHPRRREYIRRKPGQALNGNMIQSTRKFSPSLMVWGAIRSDGTRVICRCEGNVDQYAYQEILEQNLGRIVTGRYVFQQDGATCHTARSTKEYMTRKRIRLLPEWPPQSPDLSLIEHIWEILKAKVAARNGLEELWEVVKDEWEKISNDQIAALYKSMISRIKAVVLTRGSNTKY